MSRQGEEENKTEEATPSKLRRARERGQVARGNDLSFLSANVALILVLLMFGGLLGSLMLGSMTRSLTAVSLVGTSPQLSLELLAQEFGPAIQVVLVVGLITVLLVAAVEIMQLRGIVWSTHPLKPDFSRMNPAQGLKRLFSVRTLKETLKNIIKLALYGAAGWIVISGFSRAVALSIQNGWAVAAALSTGLLLLLAAFAAVAALVAILDQIIARVEFAKEMRMSRSEFVREHKEQEGEPRQKQKRKQLHAQYAKQTKALGGLPGSDMLIVNPVHLAVALAYDPSRMTAPTVTAVGRNNFALILKERAVQLGIPILHDPPLARALHAGAEPGREIAADQYVAVAGHYLRLREQAALRSRIS